MRSYHEDAHFSVRAVGYYRAAVQIVQALPDPPKGRTVWRCHEVARAVGQKLGLPVVDGWFGRVDHSWLLIPTPDNAGTGHAGCRKCAEAVLDVYACGSLPQVQLHATDGVLPFRDAYDDGEPRTDIDEEAVALLLASPVGRAAS